MEDGVGGVRRSKAWPSRRASAWGGFIFEEESISRRDAKNLNDPGLERQPIELIDWTGF